MRLGTRVDISPRYTSIEREQDTAKGEARPSLFDVNKKKKKKKKKLCCAQRDALCVYVYEILHKCAHTRKIMHRL